MMMVSLLMLSVLSFVTPRTMSAWIPLVIVRGERLDYTPVMAKQETRYNIAQILSTKQIVAQVQGTRIQDSECYITSSIYYIQHLHSGKDLNACAKRYDLEIKSWISHDVIADCVLCLRNLASQTWARCSLRRICALMCPHQDWGLTSRSSTVIPLEGIKNGSTTMRWVMGSCEIM